jgi:hypothetical protein
MIATPTPEQLMRFGPFGSFVQISPGNEGFTLWEADLIDTGGDEWEMEIKPTPRLRSMFSSMPDMDALYPVLIELVVYYAYRGIPVTRRLAELGITQEGLAALYRRVRQAASKRY